MRLTPETTVADIVTASLATIPVFQRHQIDFCCGGKVPLLQACRARGLDVAAVLTELHAAVAPAPRQEPNWADASLTAIVGHIQRRYHEPLRAELPRLGGMLQKVVGRHGEHLPGTLPPLQRAFESLTTELLDHMDREDRVLFPAIVALETGGPQGPDAAAWIAQPIAVMESDHEAAGAALAEIRKLTDGFAPPDWACPTFRGLYCGLAQLESDMHLHVHLENNVLFPRALRRARPANV